MPKYSVQRINLENSKQKRAFLRLPEEIYRGISQYVPPLFLDSLQAVNPRSNPYFDHSTAAFFLAYDGSGEPVGRLACLNHKLYNQYNQESTAFFHLFESKNLPEASHLLFNHAFEWAKSQGLTRMIGPKGFSAFDGLGVLVEGYEYPPAVGIPYNPPYYPSLIENAGFQSTNDILSGQLEKGFKYDPKIDQVALRVQERRGLRIAFFRNRSDLKVFLAEFHNLYNDAINGTVGNYPITVAEAKGVTNQILWFGDPSLIKIIMKEDQPVGFLFAYPDISPALKRCQGRIFPIGWLDLLHELRTTRSINVNGMALREEYRGSGGTAILFKEIIETVNNSRYTHAEIIQIGAENTQMLRELSLLGVKFHKKHRMYHKVLSP